jgi:inactivated superfamily I helicase
LATVLTADVDRLFAADEHRHVTGDGRLAEFACAAFRSLLKPFFDSIDPARMLSTFRHPSALGDLLSASTGTNASTNLKRQRGGNQGEVKSMLLDEGAVYYPEELWLLGQVLDQVVRSLPPNLRTTYNLTALAKNMLAYASTGERDPDELRRGALMNSKLAVAA